MKILWITNVLFDYHHCLLGNDRRKATTSGSWLSAAYDATKKNPNIELHVVTTSDVPETLVGQSERAHFYILPGGSLFRYDVTSEKNLTYIKKLKDRIACVHLKDIRVANGKPDIQLCEVGAGNVNWDDVLDACKYANVPYAVVEQDYCENSPFDSLKQSYDYLVPKYFEN